MAFWKSGGISRFMKNTNEEPMSVPMKGMRRVIMTDVSIMRRYWTSAKIWT